ncbi:MAG TPA: serine hydrolase domain-containing protein [Pirellulales bacterium]|nr:serine hydrolase domain-containing protein [Pirellulales bacterium]
MPRQFSPKSWLWLTAGRLVLPHVALVVLLLVSSRVAAETPLAAAIDRLVKKQGFTDEGPGVAILIVQPGRTTFKKGYGLAKLHPKTPITPETLFELASVSKTFTATGTLRLAEQKKLSIDDDVRDYLPELPEYDPQRPIRIRDLLQHTSGLPDYMQFADVPARHKDFWVNEDYAAEFARQREQHPLDFRTGRKYEYNNTNFMLLALIVERVSKRSFGTFLHDEVFAPAGMTSTFVYENPSAVPAGRGTLCAIGYEKTKKGWDAAWGVPPDRHETLLTVGDGAVWTNLADMAHWDAALRHHKLLNAATLREALKPSRTDDGQTNGYGLGWSVYLDDSGRMNGFGHDGSWGGFRTSYYHYQLADRTTVILSNRGSFDPDKFWYALNDVVEKAGW